MTSRLDMAYDSMSTARAKGYWAGMMSLRGAASDERKVEMFYIGG